MKELIPIIGFVAALALIFSQLAAGTPEIAKKENRQCVYCHPSVGKPDLNEAGKYYKDHGSLEGYRERKPGSSSGPLILQ